MNALRLSYLATVNGLVVAIQTAPIHKLPRTFVGMTPCGDVARAFVSGTANGASCNAIRWELTLGAPDGANHWHLKAVYGEPVPNGYGAIDGPTVTNQGTFVTSTTQRFGGPSTLYRLATDAGSSIAFAQVGSDIIILAQNDGSLVAGTSAGGYALTRDDRLEPPVAEVSRAPEGSYTMPPKDTGSVVFGIFGGRSPCAALARELRLPNADGCARVKWRLTLLKDPRTNEPTIYKVDNSLNRGRSWTGAWRIVRGAPGFPDATVYQLDAGTSRGPILLLRADDKVVLFLDHERQPLPGNADFSYTLSRTDP